jgi:uncharacterized lipoprotein YmbA
MSRLILLFLACSLAGCASNTYTIQAASLADANSRAQRYCYLQDSTAQLTGVEQRGGKSVEVYRCVPGAQRPAQSLGASL